MAEKKTTTENPDVAAAAQAAEIARLKAEAAAAKAAAAEAAAKAAELAAAAAAAESAGHAGDAGDAATDDTAVTKETQKSAKKAAQKAASDADEKATAADKAEEAVQKAESADTDTSDVVEDSAQAEVEQAADQAADQSAEQAADAAEKDPRVAALVDGYAFDDPTLALGCGLIDENNHPDIKIGIPLKMMNRHGLVAGATGTGKTRTLQLMAERLSAAGVPVFITDVKGDLSGLMAPGKSSDKMLKRTASQGQENWTPTGFPTEILSLGAPSEKFPGVPVRTRVEEFGSLLLARAMDLNNTQTQALQLLFEFAKKQKLPLDDLKDLQDVLNFLTNTDEGKERLKKIGGVSTASAGVILRATAALNSQGGDQFFGIPSFDTRHFLRTDADGRGVISLLGMTGLSERPALVSAFVMWLLNDLFTNLPEVGDAEKPKLVFFFDEAHLLFEGASKAFLAQIEQTVKLIRSKGVGIYFVTQTPKDVPADILGQLGSRVQHALRAFTPEDVKALKATVSTFPISDFNLEKLLTELGVGEAVVTVLDPKGRPSPVAPTKLWAPESVMGPAAAAQVQATIQDSELAEKYMTAQDRQSASEILAAYAEKLRKEAEAAAQAAEEEKRREKAAKEAEKQEREREKKRAQRRNSKFGKATRAAAKTLGTELTRELVKGESGKRVLGKVLKNFFK